LLPLAVVVIVAYLGSVLWTLRISLSSSRALPRDDFVGMEQYVRLFESERWQQAVHNIALYGVLYVSTVVVLGRRPRPRGALPAPGGRCMTPPLLQAVDLHKRYRLPRERLLGPRGAVQALGWQDFQFEWIVDQDMVMYCVVFAGVWQGSGLVMALMLAGLRGVDEEIWKAAKLDGIPTWRVYVSIVLPMMTPTLATVFVLLSMGVIKLYDTVVAMTQGGPGTASDVPAKFIMDYLFARSNLGLASAGAVVLLLSVVAIVAPLAYWRSRVSARGAAA
jgi:glucose/mannose transport system permease protein